MSSYTLTAHHFSEVNQVQGNPHYFTGMAMIADLMNTPPAESGSMRLEYKYVSFDKKARTHWHTHTFAQDLFVVSGECWAQVKDGPLLKAKTGSMLHFPAGVRHWHGASPNAPMVHLAINRSGTTDWKEAVSEIEYAQ